MKCRSCSAEIDAKAIVCYRCGAPTADPASLLPRPAPARRNAVWVALAVVVLAAVAAWIYWKF